MRIPDDSWREGAPATAPTPPSDSANERWRCSSWTGSPPPRFRTEPRQTGSPGLRGGMPRSRAPSENPGPAADALRSRSDAAQPSPSAVWRRLRVRRGPREKDRNSDPEPVESPLPGSARDESRRGRGTPSGRSAAGSVSQPGAGSSRRPAARTPSHRSDRKRPRQPPEEPMTTLSIPRQRLRRVRIARADGGEPSAARAEALAGFGGVFRDRSRR